MRLFPQLEILSSRPRRINVAGDVRNNFFPKIRQKSGEKPGILEKFREINFHFILLSSFFLILSLPLQAQTSNSDPALPTIAAPRDLEMVTTEWPPYSGEELSDYGLSSATVRTVFANANMTIHLSVLPWRRALQTFRTTRDIDGIFPVYKDREGFDEMLLSAPISYSPMGFVVFHNQLFDWKTLADLQGMAIGVVAGYTNTPLFDELVASGKLRTVETNDDLTLLRLLRTNRIDVAVMDKLVMEHLLGTYQEFAQVVNSFRFHPTPLANKGLYVAFHKTPAGANLREIFNQELNRLECNNEAGCASR